MAPRSAPPISWPRPRLDNPIRDPYAPFMPAPAPPPDPLGAEIRRARESLDLTLMEFGEIVGLPWQSIAAYEAGRATPPADRLLAIVHAVRKAPRPFRLERVARAVAGLLAIERAAA